MSYKFNRYSVEYYGKSHSKEIGVKLQGLKKGTEINLNEIENLLERRKGGKSEFVTARSERDEFIVKSGYAHGKSDGNLFEAVIMNKDYNDNDYKSLSNIPRPSHADYADALKRNSVEMSIGGGAYSGRMTALMCVLGGIALSTLKKSGVKISSYISQIGNVQCGSYTDCDEIIPTTHNGITLGNEQNFDEVFAVLSEAKRQGDSLGGVIECVVEGFSSGIGGASFEGIEGLISSALFAIPAVKSVEFGYGLKLTQMKGSEANDSLCFVNGKVRIINNKSGGINGGITNGEKITLRVGFRPTPSISKPQKSVNLKTGENVIIKIEGRHDTSVVIRAVPVVESAVAFALFSVLSEREDDENLESYRNDIDQIDDKLKTLLVKRIGLSKKIGVYKQKNNIKTEDKKREESILNRLEENCSENEKMLLDAVFADIFKESKRVQKKDDDEKK